MEHLSSTTAQSNSRSPPGLWRRLVAITYDTLLLVAVLFVATAIVLPFTGGEAIRPHHPLYTAYLWLVAFAYFGWCWTHGGQTLGMRTWHIRVVTADGGAAGWHQALLRFLGALLAWVPLGAGYLWVLVDRERLAWHDRISGTKLIKVD